jgi:hypothetical protein
VIGAASETVPRSDLADAAAWIEVLADEIAKAERDLEAAGSAMTADEIRARQNDIEAARAEHRAIVRLLAAESALRGGA